MVYAQASLSPFSSVYSVTNIIDAVGTSSWTKLQVAQARVSSFLVFLKQYIGIVAKTVVFPSVVEEKLSSWRELAVLITTEKGVCGSCDTETLRTFESHYESKKKSLDVLVIGKIWKDYCIAMWYTVIADFTLNDDFSDSDIDVLYLFLQKYLHSAKYQHISLVYSWHGSCVNAKSYCISLLPSSYDTINDALFIITNGAVSYERNAMDLDAVCCLPTADYYMKEVTRQYACFLVYGAIVQTTLSELTADLVLENNVHEMPRMMIADSQRQYNKVCQWRVKNEFPDMHCVVV